VVGAETLAVAVVGQNLDHPTVSNPAPLAPGEHALELGLEGGKSRHAALDVGKMRASDPVGILAGPFRIVGELQEIAHVPGQKGRAVVGAAR
jgi:hypothetical protein